MRPTPIPDGEVWDGAERVVYGPPPGHEDDVANVEVLVDRSSIGPRISARCALEAGDLDTLQRGGVVWVSFYGAQLAPFSVDVAASVDTPVDERRPRLCVEVVQAAEPNAAPTFNMRAENVPHHMDAATFLDGIAEALHELAAQHRQAEQ